MNFMAIGSNLAPYRPALRSARINPIEQSYGNPPANRVATDVATLSLENQIDLSQKAQVLPPPPPKETKKKPSQPPTRKAEARVSTTDFSGRTCSGSLHGPLLMEEPEMEVQSLDARPAGFQSVDFGFDSPHDFAPLRSASLALAALEPSQLHAPAQDTPVATVPSSDSSFAYFGVRNGVAVMVQQFELPQAPHSSPENSQVRLPNGQIATILRTPGGESQLSIHLPASSLDELALWGQSLLAVA